MSIRIANRTLSALGLVAAALAMATPSRADTLLLDEALDDGACNSPACLQVSGGQFVPGIGWRVTGPDSRIVFDLGESLSCGSVEVTVAQFDPISGGHTEEYVNLVGIYEGSHGNNWTAAANDETQLQVSGNCDRCLGAPIADAWRDERMKFKGLACSWDYPECGGFPDGNRYLPPQDGQGIDWSANTATAWTIGTAWDCSGPRYALAGGASYTAEGTWSWHAGHADPKPRLRYLFVGKDHSGDAGAYLANAVIVRARAWRADTCNCSASPTCGDGQCNGDETAASCPADCGGGEAGSGGSGSSDGGAGGQAQTAGSDPAGGADATGGTNAAGGEQSNDGPPADADEPDDEAAADAGCSTSGVPTRALPWWTSLTATLLAVRSRARRRQTMADGPSISARLVA